MADNQKLVDNLLALADAGIIPVYDISQDELSTKTIQQIVVEAAFKCGISKSKSEARRMLAQNGFSIFKPSIGTYVKIPPTCDVSKNKMS